MNGLSISVVVGGRDCIGPSKFRPARTRRSPAMTRAVAVAPFDQPNMPTRRGSSALPSPAASGRSPASGLRPAAMSPTQSSTKPMSEAKSHGVRLGSSTGTTTRPSGNPLNASYVWSTVTTTYPWLASSWTTIVVSER